MEGLSTAKRGERNTIRKARREKQELGEISM
jgi:hypothetical protein